MIKPIDCDLYDYLEIACMHRYQMRVTLDSGAVLRGRAVTTATQPDKTEMLVLLTRQGNQNVAMHQLKRIDIETKGATFQHLEFPSRQSEVVNS